ncbi:hypothetical protein [Desulfopila inferna]|uniref:hypothetical protein n=1 Tax=Desulfopila inferna TaxID=468528 RepID=UPI001963F779|nr:hypothetical protein [Desulfopila inferna]MBM9605045.1 hypothetical protein [Desulfopila inferna]
MKIKIYDRNHGHLRTLEQITAAAVKSTNTRGEKYPGKNHKHQSGQVDELRPGHHQNRESRYMMS